MIPDTAKEKPQEGQVLAVGPGRVDDSGKRIPLDVNVGDVVLYSKYGGTEVKYSGKEYLVLSARDVLAIIEKSSRRLVPLAAKARTSVPWPRVQRRRSAPYEACIQPVG